MHGPSTREGVLSITVGPAQMSKMWIQPVRTLNSSRERPTHEYPPTTGRRSKGRLASAKGWVLLKGRTRKSPCRPPDLGTEKPFRDTGNGLSQRGKNKDKGLEREGVVGNH